MAYPLTKFEDYKFSHSRYMKEDIKSKIEVIYNDRGNTRPPAMTSFDKLCTEI